MSKFIHDRIYPGIHRRFTGKTYAILHRRMSCPNKINVAGLCLSSYRSQIILSNHSLFLLCLSKRCRIISTPISQMIRIGLRSVNEKVHFIAFTIFQQTQTIFHRVRITVKTLYNTSVLHISIIFENNGSELILLLLFKHLL